MQKTNCLIILTQLHLDQPSPCSITETFVDFFFFKFIKIGKDMRLFFVCDSCFLGIIISLYFMILRFSSCFPASETFKLV